MNSGKVVSFKQTTQEMHGRCCCDFGNVAVSVIAKTTNLGHFSVDRLLDDATQNMEFGERYVEHVEVHSGRTLLLNIQHKTHGICCCDFGKSGLF